MKVLIIMVLILLFCGCLNNEEKYWACMDGCSNMLDNIKQGMEIDEQHGLQSMCDKKCLNQYPIK